MDEKADRYLKQKARRSAPVKRVALSEEARRAYEKLIQERDEKDRDYKVHLPTDSRPR